MSLLNLPTLTFLALAVVTAAAQESIQYGSISGRIADATGAVIEGAKVSARQIDTNITSTLLSDKEGRFRLPYLKVGQYEVRIQKVGFAEVTRSVTLSLGSAYEFPVELAVASAETNVTVSGEADMLETARTQSRRYGFANRGGIPAPERAQFPGPRAAGSRVLPPTPRVISFSRKPQPCRGKASRSAASVISRTTSSWMVFRPTTMRRG